MKRLWCNAVAIITTVAILVSPVSLLAGDTRSDIALGIASVAILGTLIQEKGPKGPLPVLVDLLQSQNRSWPAFVQDPIRPYRQYFPGYPVLVTPYGSIVFTK